MGAGVLGLCAVLAGWCVGLGAGCAVLGWFCWLGAGCAVGWVGGSSSLGIPDLSATCVPVPSERLYSGSVTVATTVRFTSLILTVLLYR